MEALILSALALYTTNNSLMAAPYWFYSPRFIVLIIACLVSRNLIDFIVMVAIIAMRVELGGMGTPPGGVDAIAVFIIAAACGSWMRHRARLIAYGDPVALGFVSSLTTFGAWFLLRWGAMEVNWANHELTLGLLSGNGIGMLILGTLIIWDNKLQALQRALSDPGAKFHDIIDNMPVSFAISDRDVKVRFVNRRFLERYGEDFIRFIGQDADQQRSHVYSGEQYVQSLAAELAPPEAGSLNRHAVGTLKTGEPYIRITIADNGPGMEQDVVERLVEPFFTALNRGDRSGLGLSIVLGIMGAYGGVYPVTTRPGHGTAFNFYFPANEAGMVSDVWGDAPTVTKMGAGSS